MTATAADAAEIVRHETPEAMVRLADAFSVDLSLASAAEAIGMPLGRAKAIAKDPRYWRYIHAVMAADRAACDDMRRQALQMLAALVAFDPAQAFDKYSEVKNIHEIPAEVRCAITAFEKTPDGRTKIRFVSRLDALKLLMQHFGDVPTGLVNDAPPVRAQVIFRGRGDGA